MPSARLLRCNSGHGPILRVSHVLHLESFGLHGRPPSLTRPLRLSAQFSVHSPLHPSTSKAQGYDQLRRQALVGKYENVQHGLEKLVKVHEERPNSRIYEALMVANADCWNGSVDEVARLLRNMAGDAINLNSAILHNALQALAVHPDYLLRSYILRELRQRWLSLSQSGWHDVVAGLIRERQIEKALEALENMQEAGVTPQGWLLDAILYTLCSLEEFDEALRLLQHRLGSGDVTTSPTLWTYILDSASRSLHHSLTLFVFDTRVRTLYMNPSSGVCANILSTAARHGDAELGSMVIRVLSRRSGSAVQLHHYEALLDIFVARKYLRRALSLLAIMKANGTPPTERSTRTIFTYLSQCRQNPYKAHELLYLIRDEGRIIPIQAINVLIEAYIYHQRLSTALDLYKSMETLGSTLSPNIATFNNLLRGCASHKRKDIAMFLAREMVVLDVAPNSLTYDRLLLVCVNADRGLDNAWRYFDEMKAAGWQLRGGTAITLAKKACALRDHRIWGLIEDENGWGLPMEKLKSIANECWRSGEAAIATE